jgi:maltose-binding protein MalE
MAGHGPHLMLLHNHTIGDLAADNLLLPLDDLVSPTTRNQLLPAAIGGGQVQDLDGTSHLYGLPLTFDTLALYYRKDLVDTPPQDMETLLRVAHSLTEPSPTEPQPRQWGLACTLSLDKTIGYLYAYGGHIFNTEGHLVLGSEGRAGTERWLRWLQRLHQDSQILAVRDDITVESVVKTQQAAMTIDWAHALPSYHALWGDNLGVAMLPTIQKQPPRPYVQSLVLGINARSTPYEQQAALDFISYLLSNEPQKTLLEGGQQPVLLNLGINGPPPQRQAAHVFRAQAGRGQAMPNSPAMQDIIRDELERMQVTVLQGLVGPSEAVTYADTALRERLHLPSRPPLPSPTTGAGAARPLTTSGWFIMPE